MQQNVPNKSIVKNSVWNILYKGFTAIFPLITSIYVARVLLPDNLGKVTYANTIVSWFTLLASLGIPNYGVRMIAQTVGNEKNRNKIFSELFFINLLSTIIVTIIYYLVVNGTQYFVDRKELLNVMGVMLVLNVFNIDWLFEGMEEYGIIATRGTVMKMISLVMVVLFVKNQNDYIKYALVLCMAMAGNYIFNIIKARQYVKISFLNIRAERHLKPVFVLLASSIATEVYTMLDTVMIEHFYGDANVAYYSNSMRIVRTAYVIEIALVSVFYPRISFYLKMKNYEASNELLTQGTKILFLLSVPSAIGLGMIANRIIPVLFGNAYMESIAVLQILSALLVIFSFAYLLGHVVLLASGSEKYILYATSMGAIVNFILNSIMIPRYRQNGAAIASVIAEFTVTAIMIYFSRRIFTIKLNKKFFLSFISALMGMIVVIEILNSFLTYNIISLCVIIVIAAAVYVSILLLLRNETALQLEHMVITKLKK